MAGKNDKIVESLLEEFKKQRDAIVLMITDLEGFKSKIDKLLPSSLDARYLRFFEEKVKSATELFKTILEMRKEIQKSLKDEIDLRRKIDIEDSHSGIEDTIDVRKIAERVEEYKRKTESMKLQILEKAKRETDEMASQITAEMNKGG
jgi:hypothetical protein